MRSEGAKTSHAAKISHRAPGCFSRSVLGRPTILLIRFFEGREWLGKEAFPPEKAGRSATVPALQSNPEQEK